MFKKLQLKILTICLALVLTPTVQAFVLDLNSGILQGRFDRNTTQTNAIAINSVGLFANLSKSESNLGVNLGWYVTAVSIKESYPTSSSYTLTSNDMGPAVRWQIGKNNTFSLTFVYGLIYKGNYGDGAVDESLTGESYLVKFAFEPALSERYFIGAGINYYAANYKTSIVNSVQNEVSYKNMLIYPSLSFSYRYGSQAKERSQK